MRRDPGDHFESERFGHEKGSFTGAIQSPSDRLDARRLGNAYSSEIGDLMLRAPNPKLCAA